jgi:hypothetical protein
MSRGNGKHTQRKPEVLEVEPDSPLGRQLGMSQRTQGVPSPIPGGKRHRGNHSTVRQEVPVPDSEPEITDQNAHGVPPGSATSRERAEIERGPNTVHATMPRPQHPTKGPEKPMPIPVYVVQDARNNVLRSAAPHNITVPGTGSDPVRLCGADGTRTAVMLLNESTAQNIRFAQTLADLTNGGGALLPWPTNSYTRIDTQDELYALTTSSTAATISIIQVFERGM